MMRCDWMIGPDKRKDDKNGQGMTRNDKSSSRCCLSTYELMVEEDIHPRKRSNMKLSERPSLTSVSINRLERGLVEQWPAAMSWATNCRGRYVSPYLVGNEPDGSSRGIDVGDDC